MPFPAPVGRALFAALGLCALAAGQPLPAAAQEMMAEVYIGKFTVYSVEGRAALADEAGAILYTNENDRDLTPTCADACARAWPPAAAIPADTPFHDFQIIARPDGIRQWAYKGRPLYRSTIDHGPGESKAIGTDGLWYVVRIQAHFMP